MGHPFHCWTPVSLLVVVEHPRQLLLKETHIQGVWLLLPSPVSLLVGVDHPFVGGRNVRTGSYTGAGSLSLSTPVSLLVVDYAQK